jgi:hypothetical protein
MSHLSLLSLPYNITEQYFSKWDTISEKQNQNKTHIIV